MPRTLAALAGTLVPALGLAIALTLALPLPLNERYLVGWFSVIPLWASLSLWVFLTGSGKQAWLLVGALSLASLAASKMAIECGRGPSLQKADR